MEWERVRHPFCPDRVESSRLLWPMYPTFMHEMNDLLNMWNKLNHTNLFMNVSSPLLKKLRSVVVSEKKNWIWFIKKFRYVFVV